MLGACTSAPPQGASAGSPAPTSSVGTVFSWGDDLSQWVTEDEMTEQLVELLGWDGTAVLSTTSGGDWEWSFKGFHVVADSGDQCDVRSSTKTDEALPEGVVFGEPGCAGSYTFVGYEGRVIHLNAWRPDRLLPEGGTLTREQVDQLVATAVSKLP